MVRDLIFILFFIAFEVIFIAQTSRIISRLDKIVYTNILYKLEVEKILMDYETEKYQKKQEKESEEK